MGGTESIGSFKVLRPLGKGGMGEVFLAEDTRLGRKVALKFLPESLQADEVAREGLIREARMASALNHPHICTIYDIGADDRGTYIVMECVEGKTLRQLLARGPLPPETLVKYGAQLAEALSYAHDKGIVHRDLKSSNVMVNEAGRLKILDFGLALKVSMATSEEQPTMSVSDTSSKLAGTIQYMAPELLSGQPADKLSDIWALGVILFEAVSGGLPFEGRSVFELSAAILHDKPKELPAHVPQALTVIIQKCMARTPQQRYLQTGEVHAALEILATTMAFGGSEALGGGSIDYWDLGALPADDVTRQTMSKVPVAPRRKALAVMPLKNLSGDPEQVFFSDCMTEALITDLARIRALKVISYASTMRYTDSEKSVAEIARELDVDVLIEGSVLRAGDQVRISARLVDAASDTHLWADSYMRSFTDIFELQSDVARAIANEIQVQLTPQEGRNLAHRGKVNPAAHEALLKGQHAMAKPERLGEAIDWFEKAIKLDSGSAMAHTLLAQSYLLVAMYGFRRPLDVYPVAKINAKKALDLDESSAEAHCIMAWASQLYEFDHKAVDKGYRRSLELNPGAEETLRLYGCYLLGTGRTDKGLQMLRKSAELSPQAPLSNSIFAYGLYVARQYSQAAEHCDLVIENHPRFWWARWVKGEILTAKGAYDEATAQYELALTASQNAFTMGSLGAAYGFSGQTEKANKLLADLEQQAAVRYVSPYFISMIHIGLGNSETALDWLERAWEERDGWAQWLLVNPAVDRVRSDPRYDQLLKRMALR